MVSPATLVKPGHLLCYGIGQAGHGFPGYPGQARPFALLWYWPSWPRFPRLPWSSQAICSVMVLAGLAMVSPATLVKPDHLLCYGIGRAGRGFDPDLPRSDRALDARD